MVRRALRRVGRADVDRVLVDVVLVGEVEMPVVEVANVVRVANRGVAAIRSVHVIVPIVLVVTHEIRIRPGRLGVTVGRPL